VSATAVEGGIGAQIAAKLDAGIGAGNVEEAGAVRRADFHVLDRLGLDWQIGRMGGADGHQAGRRTENEIPRRLH